MTSVTHMLPADVQLANEYRFNKKHIDGYIRKELSTGENAAKITQGVQLLSKWRAGDYYTSKNARLAQIQDLELSELVTEFFVSIAYVQREELFTSVSAQLASKLGFSDKPEALTTIAEMLAVLCETDAFDIIKPNPQASLSLCSRLDLSEQLREYIENATFLPPMVCPPNYVDNNRKSGYLTHNDSLVLGRGNHHEGDLCLDIINLQNQIPLQLDKQFLCSFNAAPKHALDTAEQIEQWHLFQKQSYKFFTLLVQQGNRMYLTHKVDKRGRLYSVGYHITTQGSAFQKAMLELADEEIVEGV